MFQRDTGHKEAIQQLTGEKIIFGYDDGSFGFGDNVTREQVAALMYRYFNMEENKNMRTHTVT